MVHKPSPSKRKSSLHFTVNLFICMVLITAVAFISVLTSSAFAGSKTASVNVSVLKNTTDRTVIHYDFGDFSQQQVTIENHTYNAIVLKGESNKKEVGAPALPDVSRSIIIADDALVEVNVLDSKYYEIEDFDIVPSKGYISREINPADVPYTFGNVYQSDTFYPSPLAQLGKPYIMRDHRGVVVTVNPFQYNPVQRLLRVYTQMTVEVTAIGPGKINVLQRDVLKRKLSRAFHTIYSSHFINYTLTERYAILDEEGELLIIVHDVWNSNVLPLKVHKDNIGISTTIQNVSTIPGGGNLDTAIKAYIQGIYDDPTRDLAFVLLVGDLAHVDSFTAVTGEDGESDPKYSKLAGSDDYPDIIVGRLSAETAADVDTQVERIIEYETMPAVSQNWFWQGTGIASDGGTGNGDDSEWDWEHMRNIRTDLLNYGYIQVDELYDGSQGGGDAAGNPTDTMVSTSVNAGRGIMNYCGHGDITSWATTGFNNSDVNALTNDNMLPFIFDVACLNGNFGETTCFAEAWMRATNVSEPTGAIGIYASSINQPWNPPMEAQDEFNLLYVAESYNSYGAYCYAAACSMMDDYPGNGETYGNGHATFNTWHIFGDPTLRITDPPPPPCDMELGQTTIDHNWKTVNLSCILQNAVYILGPPTYHGTDPGVVRLQNVTDNSFDIRFQEWLYKDGGHTQENIPYLVIPDGWQQKPDGSIWEAGTFSLSGAGAWISHAFTDTFPSMPALFLTTQTYNGSDPITVRARNVTNTGFEAALFEEENKMDGHTTEVVGYLAVYSPQLSGTVNINGTDVPYLLQAQSVDHRFVPVLSSDIKLEEEQSKDSEIGHINETVSILALGDKIFTQDISSNGGDTIAIRRLAPEYGAAMEWGTVDGVDHNWMKIPLAKEYMNPVIVAKPVSSRGGDPGVIRIRNVFHNSFELRYNEWAYKDGGHTQERVFYMVVEAGERSVAGLTVEAGRLNTSKLLADGWEPITFSAFFSQTPSVFTSVQTYNGGDPVTTRLSDCTIAGFDLTMDEEEAKNDGHTTETIGWVAIEKGSGNTNDNRSVVVLSDSTNHIPTQINFGQSMARRFPVVVSDMITTYGADPCFLRYQDLLPSSIDLFIQEEASLDAEMNHVVEDVSLFVAE